MNSETDDVIHWVWDDNPDEALCGIDMVGQEWATDNDPITCARCLEIQDAIVQSEILGLGLNA
jgi:hypothetical protein